MHPIETKSLSAVFIMAFAMGNASANDSKYGVAPASLDYPSTLTEASVGASKNSNIDFLAMQQEELSFLVSENPFPEQEFAKIDPISKKKVDGVLVGPPFRSRSIGSDYDYYRYITFYRIQYRKERIYGLPVLRENCNDRSEAFGSYNYSQSYSSSVNASVSYEGLGLGTSFSETRTFITARNLYASGNLVADHTPYFLKQDWVGSTYIQTYSEKTRKSTFLKSKAMSWWKSALFFPQLAYVKYPFAFEVMDADWTLLVERTIIDRCETAGFGDSLK